MIAGELDRSVREIERKISVRLLDLRLSSEMPSASKAISRANV